MPPFILATRISGKGSGVPYIVTARNSRSPVLKVPRNAIQQIAYSPDPTGGTYDLVFGGQTTSDINYNDMASTIQSELEALSTIGSGNVVVSGSGPFSVQFVGAMGGRALANMTVANNSLVAADDTISVTTTTPGAAAVQASYILDPGAASTGAYAVTGNPGGVNSFAVPITGGTDPTVIQANYNAVIANASVSSADGSTPDLWLVTFTGPFGQEEFPTGYPMIGSNSTDGNPTVGSVVQGSAAVYQIDTIALDSNVNGGSWHVGGMTGIAYDDTGSGVQAAIEAYLSISGGTIGNPSAGVWTYQYATAGDQSSNTSQLAANTAGDTLTQPVTVSVTAIQVGG